MSFQLTGASASLPMKWKTERLGQRGGGLEAAVEGGPLCAGRRWGGGGGSRTIYGLEASGRWKVEGVIPWSGEGEGVG